MSRNVKNMCPMRRHFKNIISLILKQKHNFIGIIITKQLLRIQKKRNTNSCDKFLLSRREAIFVSAKDAAGIFTEENTDVQTTQCRESGFHFRYNVHQIRVSNLYDRARVGRRQT